MNVLILQALSSHEGFSVLHGFQQDSAVASPWQLPDGLRKLFWSGQGKDGG